MGHIFISYSHKDTHFAEKLEDTLNAHGIKTWRDPSIGGGEDWYRALIHAMYAAYGVIQVVTPSAEESVWVLREALYAQQQGIPIIPVLPATRKLPFYLLELQPIVCDEPSYDGGIAQLVEALRALPEESLGERLGLPTPDLGPADRATELAYLDFLLSEANAELRTRLYVSLSATKEIHRSTVLSQGLPGARQLKLDRLGLERVRGEAFDQSGEAVADVRIPLRESKHALLLGDPGSGKTTTLLQLVVDLAQEAKDDPAAPLPVFVPLRSYQGEQPVEEFVKRQLGILESQYERLLAEGRLLLLCDAFNEMRREQGGRQLVDDVRAFLRRPGLWVVSCRVRDYQEELRGLQDDLVKIRLKPLTLPNIHDVIGRRFLEAAEKGDALWQALHGSDLLLTVWNAFEEAGKTDLFWEYDLPATARPADVKMDWEVYKKVWRILQDKRKLLLLCRTPYMLHVVCEIFDITGELPANRGQLFAVFVEDLLAREEAVSLETGSAWGNVASVRRGLSRLAYEMQEAGRSTEIDRDKAERILSQIDGIDDSRLVLRLASAASLIEVGDSVRFTHQLLQEYFASEIMGQMMDEGRAASDFWSGESWWEPQGWEETAILLAGYRDPKEVAQWIAPANPVLAERCLLESGTKLSLESLVPERVDLARHAYDLAQQFGIENLVCSEERNTPLYDILDLLARYSADLFRQLQKEMLTYYPEIYHEAISGYWGWLSPRELGSFVALGHPKNWLLPEEIRFPLVLISHGDVGSLTLFRIMLERGGFRPLLTYSAFECLLMAEVYQPDLIISNIGRDDLSGFELLRRLRDDPETRKCPFVFLSSRGDTETMLRAMELGANDFLPSPILHHDLINYIRRMTSSSA